MLLDQLRPGPTDQSPALLGLSRDPNPLQPPRPALHSQLQRIPFIGLHVMACRDLTR